MHFNKWNQIFNNLIDNHTWDDKHWKQEASSLRHLDLKHFERLLRHNPPLHILKRIHELHPSWYGRGLPLQVLASHGASPESLRFVANAFNPVEITDEQGNKPIDLILDKLWYGREQKQMQRDSVLELLKLSDPGGFDTALTGLPNRTILNKYGHRLMPGCKSPSVLLVFLDLFGFKAINDKLSDNVGDLALKHFAKEFDSIAQFIVKQYNVYARVFRYHCGDEFVMLFLMDPEREAKESLVQNIYQELKSDNGMANVRWGSKENDIGPGFKDTYIPDVNTIPRCGFCYSNKVSTAGEIEKLRQVAALLEKGVKLDIKQNLENKDFKFTRGAVVSLDMVNQIGTPQFSPLEKYSQNLLTTLKTKHSLDGIDAEMIDVCIISLHPPSMMHRLSSASNTIHDIGRKLKPLSDENNISILLVDGNDQDEMNHLKKNLEEITSLIFIGEGLLMDEASTTESSGQSSSDILDLLIKLNTEHKCRPQVSIAFKYGANAIKGDLGHHGFKEVDVWDLSNERSDVVDVWKDGHLFGHLKRHLSSMKKDKKGYPSVDVLAWTPPTQDWRKKIIGNLSLKVGDVEEIDKIKKIVIQAIKSEQTKCFEIQPLSFHDIDDDPYRRARSITYFMCQESSRAIKDTYFYSTCWYYVSKNEHLSEVANEIEDKRSGCVVIWIDGIDSYALNLEEGLLEKSITGDLKVIYIVTKNLETTDHDIVGPIQKIHKLSENDMRLIHIDPEKSDIELSQREVSVDVTLLETPKNHGCKLLEEFFDTTSAEGNFVEQHEATFYRGDDESVHLHVGVRNIKQLKQIFAFMFFPDSKKTLESKLRSIGLRTKLEFKIRNPLKFFKQCVLELDTLTPDQEIVRRQATRQRRVVINGRAGSGKTYLALHFILERLTISNKINGKENDGIILFCFNAESLGNEIVKWLCTRLGDSSSINEKNEKLRRVHFLYNIGEKPGLLYQIQIDESFGEPELMVDYDSLDDAIIYEYDLIVVDEGHHIFKKSGGGFLYRNTFSRFLSKDKKRRKKIKRILKKNKHAQVMILCDSSQAPSTQSKWPKEFNNEETHLTFTEVIRSLPILTEASSLFQRFNQDKTTNLNSKLKGKGLRPGVILFKSDGVKRDYIIYVTEIVAELKKIMSLFPNEELHNTVAIIVPNDDARKCLLNAGFESKLDEMGFRAVTAKEASERFSNDPPSDGKGHIIVDTISSMNGLERLFIIAVDMDKPLGRHEEKKHKNLSEIYCACTRGMLYVSFVNKYIENGWMSFFNFTKSEVIPLPSSIQDISSSSGAIIDKAIASDQQEPSSIPTLDDQSLKNEDIHVLIGAANAVCQSQVDKTYSYKSSHVKVLARTNIFDISKSNLDSIGEGIPTFHPLVSDGVGMSPLRPFIYKGGRAPKVPYIEISPNVGAIEMFAFYQNKVIERLVIPNTVTYMRNRALQRCSKLKDVIFEEGSSLRHIGKYAFYECPKIEEMKLPASLTTLEVGAFNDCKGLKKVTLSPKMTAVEAWTFSRCSSLTYVEGMNAIQSIAENAFRGCPSLETIDVNQSADIHRNAFFDCNVVINRSLLS